MIRPISKV